MNMVIPENFTVPFSYGRVRVNFISDAISAPANNALNRHLARLIAENIAQFVWSHKVPSRNTQPEMPDDMLLLALPEGDVCVIITAVLDVALDAPISPVLSDVLAQLERELPRRTASNVRGHSEHQSATSTLTV
jgi:hypothetical protein